LISFVDAPLQCVGVINLGGEVGCMISEGPWVFVGIPNFVKVRKNTNRDLFLFFSHFVLSIFKQSISL